MRFVSSFMNCSLLGDSYKALLSYLKEIIGLMTVECIYKASRNQLSAQGNVFIREYLILAIARLI